MTTYEQMCLAEPMRTILAGLWKSKQGDFYVYQSHPESMLFCIEDARGIDNYWAGDKAWRPTEGQLMELLGDNFLGINRTKGGKMWLVRLKLPERTCESFMNTTRGKSLLLAFAHTQGLKWEGKWERRDRG